MEAIFLDGDFRIGIQHQNLALDLVLFEGRGEQAGALVRAGQAAVISGRYSQYKDAAFEFLDLAMNGDVFGRRDEKPPG